MQAFLEARPAGMHHHLALHDDQDVETLCRFVRGRAIGFVAGGGGALGIAHIGIFQVLQEHGIKFDFLGGTSVGSAIMGGFALGATADVILDATEDIFIRSHGFKRPTWPKYALLDHRNFDNALRRQFQNYRIEDTWINYFALSANLSSVGVHVHRTGELWRAVRASSAIPGLLPPMYEKGQMLVDGCLIENVPLSTMKNLKTGPNVVVHFGLPEYKQFDIEYDNIPHRGRLLLSLVSPFHRKLIPPCPTAFEVLARSLVANSANSALPSGPEDLILEPPRFSSAGNFNWRNHSEIYAASRDWARDYIEKAEGNAQDAALNALRDASSLFSPKSRSLKSA
jgi:NTE family protein